jgi:hypothetical protein
VSPVLHARAALLPLARHHDVPSSLSSPCPMPTVSTGPRDGSRSTRRSRPEGPEPPHPSRRPRQPRRSPHLQPTRHNYRKRSWNIRLTWIVWYPIGYRTIRGSPIFRAKPAARPARRRGRNRHGIHLASPPPAATAPPARPRRTRLRCLTSGPPHQQLTAVSRLCRLNQPYRGTFTTVTGGGHPGWPGAY